MTGVARQFMLLAIAFLLAGVVIGLHMAISQDHTLTPAHAHVMLAGWVSSAIFALFYQVQPAAAASIWARVHFILGSISAVVMTGSLVLLLTGHAGAEPGAAVGSMGFGLSVLIFARNVLVARA